MRTVRVQRALSVSQPPPPTVQIAMKCAAPVLNVQRPPIPLCRVDGRASDFSDSFHVYSVEWNERSITWSIDGEQCAFRILNASVKSLRHLLYSVDDDDAKSSSTPIQSIGRGIRFLYVGWDEVSSCPGC